MSGKIRQRIRGVPVNLWQAMVEVDVDPDAEHVVILNRKSLERMVYHRVVAPATAQLRVPIEHSNNNDLIVGLLDDDGEYDAKFVDGVQAELIDGNLVTMQR